MQGSEEIKTWWSQKIAVSEIRATMRDIISDYKDDEEESEYADAAQEVLDYLRGMKGKIYRPTNVDNHTDFLMMRAGMAIINEDRSLFIYTSGQECVDSKKIKYYG